MKELSDHGRNDLYITNFGRVIKKVGGGTCTEHIEIIHDRELRPLDSSLGYYRITLNNRVNKYDKSMFVHDLVALYFIHTRPNKLVIDHKDRQKLNNEVNNLHYVTSSANSYNRPPFKKKKL
jgi:hypothetical protein